MARRGVWLIPIAYLYVALNHVLSCTLTVECFPPGENHVLVYGPVDWGRSCMGYLRGHLEMPFWGLLPLPLTSTNGIESLWACFKRSHKGIYHKMNPKHI